MNGLWFSLLVSKTPMVMTTDRWYCGSLVASGSLLQDLLQEVEGLRRVINALSCNPVHPPACSLWLYGYPVLSHIMRVRVPVIWLAAVLRGGRIVTIADRLPTLYLSWQICSEENSFKNGYEAILLYLCQEKLILVCGITFMIHLH